MSQPRFIATGKAHANCALLLAPHPRRHGSYVLQVIPSEGCNQEICVIFKLNGVLSQSHHVASSPQLRYSLVSLILIAKQRYLVLMLAQEDIDAHQWFKAFE